MRVLVTGAGGYLGHAVRTALAAHGHNPIAMVRNHTDPIPDAGETRAADLLAPVALRRALTGVDAVCHLAGITRVRESLSDPLRYFRINTTGTLGLLAAMADAGAQHLIFASTCAIYGSPATQPMTEDLPDAPPHPYAASKLAAELAIEAQARTGALAATILRLPNIAGGHDPDPTRLIPRTLAAAASGATLEVNGDGTAVRDYLHVADAATAFTTCVDHAPPLGTATRYNLGTGRGTSVLDIVAAVEQVTGRPVALRHGPAAPEPAALVSDPTRMTTETGWAPKHSGITEIISDTWQQMRRHDR
ncbi:NAD-dependent epimerase/dehydratase family protein [Nocardia sp. IFM 10818]